MEDPICMNADPDQCPVLAPYKTQDFVECRWEGQLVDEDVGLWTPIERLPGCNAMWPWGGPDKKPVITGDDCTPTPGYVSPNLMLEIGGNSYFPQALEYYNGVDPKSLGGCDTPHECPVWHEWAQGYRTGNITYVQHGTQEEVLANMAENSENNRLVIPGLQNDDNYSARTATKTYGGAINQTYVLTMETTFTAWCDSYLSTQPIGLPCITGTAAATSTAPATSSTGLNTSKAATSSSTSGASSKAAATTVTPTTVAKATATAPTSSEAAAGAADTGIVQCRRSRRHLSNSF
jgi:hypothetical protein